LKRARENAERAAAELTNEVLEPTRRRLRLGFRLLQAIYASYVVFLNRGWATDSYTGAFSGRNFGGGPRDSNEWGPFARPSAKSDGTGHAGEGPLAAHIDLGNLQTLAASSGLRDMFRALGLLTHRYPQGLVLRPEEWNEEMLAALRKQRDCLMWPGCALERAAHEVSELLTRTKIWLDDWCLVNLEKFSALLDKPDQWEQVEAELVSAFRRELARHAGSLEATPQSVRGVFSALSE
jgi:hypothetical protein